MLKNTLIVFLSTLLIGISCKKKDDVVATSSIKDILIASKWNKFDYKENGVVRPFFAACELDDIVSFGIDNKCRITDGTTACPTGSFNTSVDDFGISTVDNVTMSWQFGSGKVTFSENNTKFTFTRTGANTFEYIFKKMP